MATINLKEMINAQKVNMAQTPATTARMNMAAQNSIDEEVDVVQLVTNRNTGLMYAYGVRGLYTPSNPTKKTYLPVTEDSYTPVITSTQEGMLMAVIQRAVTVIQQATKAGRRTNVRLILNDRAAIKHFLMMKAQNEGKDPVAEMCRGNVEYGPAMKEWFGAYVQAVTEFLNVTGKRLLVETYRSQSFWDLQVADGTDISELTEGLPLNFVGTQCVSVPGLSFVEQWHTRRGQYKLHLDTAVTFDENGSIVMDDNGKPVRHIRGLAVYRPQQNGVPTNLRCAFVLKTLAQAGKDNVPDAVIKPTTEADFDDLI